MLTSLLLSLSLALGADLGDPSLGARVEGEAALGPAGPIGTGAVGVDAAVPLVPGVEVGVGAAGGLDTVLGPRIVGLGGVRVRLGEGALSLVGSGGGGWWAG